MTTGFPDEFKFLSIERVAELARCHSKTVRRAIKRGDLKAFRNGKSTKLWISENEALAWVSGLEKFVPVDPGEKG